MEAMIRQRAKSSQGDVFLELVKAFGLKPIRSESEHEQASRILGRMVGSKPESQFSRGERDYIDALTILVRDYQQKRINAERAVLAPVQILRHLMEENSMTVSDL